LGLQDFEMENEGSTLKKRREYSRRRKKIVPGSVEGGRVIPKDPREGGRLSFSWERGKHGQERVCSMESLKIRPSGAGESFRRLGKKTGGGGKRKPLLYNFNKGHLRVQTRGRDLAVKWERTKKTGPRLHYWENGEGRRNLGR